MPVRTKLFLYRNELKLFQKLMLENVLKHEPIILFS
jgi:hypothetical protein